MDLETWGQSILSILIPPLSVESILAKGDRVELIPVKDGVKVIQVKRKEIKITSNRVDCML